jgi:hypothetical protein
MPALSIHFVLSRLRERTPPLLAGGDAITLRITTRDALLRFRRTEAMMWPSPPAKLPALDDILRRTAALGRVSMKSDGVRLCWEVNRILIRGRALAKLSDRLGFEKSGQTLQSPIRRTTHLRRYPHDLRTRSEAAQSART